MCVGLFYLRVIASCVKLTETKKAIGAAGAIPRVLEALAHHLSDSDVQAAGCGALASLAAGIDGMSQVSLCAACQPSSVLLLGYAHDKYGVDTEQRVWVKQFDRAQGRDRRGWRHCDCDGGNGGSRTAPGRASSRVCGPLEAGCRQRWCVDCVATWRCGATLAH